jgi:hypothetical protein
MVIFGQIGVSDARTPDLKSNAGPTVVASRRSIQNARMDRRIMGIQSSSKNHGVAMVISPSRIDASSGGNGPITP